MFIEEEQVHQKAKNTTHFFFRRRRDAVICGEWLQMLLFVWWWDWCDWDIWLLPVSPVLLLSISLVSLLFWCASSTNSRMIRSTCTGTFWLHNSKSIFVRASRSRSNNALCSYCRQITVYFNFLFKLRCAPATGGVKKPDYRTDVTVTGQSLT